MRRLDSNGHPEKLLPDEIAELLQKHIPYRLNHLLDATFRIPARCMADNQSFEAGAVAGRSLLSLLGIGYNAKTGDVRSDRVYHCAAPDHTDDIKSPDLGGRFVEIDNLSIDDKTLLARFIHGVHKSSAHFTWKSNQGLDVPTYIATAKLITRLVTEHLPNKADQVSGGTGG